MNEAAQPLPFDWPLAADSRRLDAAAVERGLRTANGLPLRFLPPPVDTLGYEARIAQTGVVATRSGNLHDHYNALAWLNFPRAKAALSARHALALAREKDGRRDPERDALTHFDECGVVLVSDRPRLFDLLAAFAWRELFVAHRREVRAHMALLVFGHATREQLLRPFHGLTAKALTMPVGPEWFALSTAARITAVDAFVTAAIAAGRCARAGDLQPLPLLGWPGVVPASEDPAYYDDASQFRPGRKAAVDAV
jgi:hypothetical protein